MNQELIIQELSVPEGRVNMSYFDKKIDAVIFDMDGTLFDTERLITSLYQEVSQNIGKPLGIDILHNSIGLNHDATRNYVKEIYGDDFPYDEISEKVIERKLNIIEERGMPIKKGVLDVLNLLWECKMPMAIATSTHRELTEKYLSKSDLKKYFNYVVCGNEVSKSKPEPEIFLHTVSLLKVESSNCLVLEDSQNGILAAHRAGTIPILVKDIKYPDDEVRKLAFKEYETMSEVTNHRHSRWLGINAQSANFTCKP